MTDLLLNSPFDLDAIVNRYQQMMRLMEGWLRLKGPEVQQDKLDQLLTESIIGLVTTTDLMQLLNEIAKITPHVSVKLYSRKESVESNRVYFAEIRAVAEQSIEPFELMLHPSLQPERSSYENIRPFFDYWFIHIAFMQEAVERNQAPGPEIYEAVYRYLHRYNHLKTNQEDHQMENWMYEQMMKETEAGAEPERSDELEADTEIVVLEALQGDADSLEEDNLQNCLTATEGDEPLPLMDHSEYAPINLPLSALPEWTLIKEASDEVQEHSLSEDESAFTIELSADESTNEDEITSAASLSASSLLAATTAAALSELDLTINGLYRSAEEASRSQLKLLKAEVWDLQMRIDENGIHSVSSSIKPLVSTLLMLETNKLEDAQALMHSSYALLQLL